MSFHHSREPQVIVCFPRYRASLNAALSVIGVAVVLVLGTATLYAGNQAMGELHLKGKSKVEKTSGVWIDGQYVGYLKELKGSKKILLLPGQHTVMVRQDGYQDFVQTVDVGPGQQKVLHVEMQKGPTGAMPKETATVKLIVNPPRAAVFLDGMFVGHASEFQGLGHGLLIAPGTHAMKIALPGYQTFDTQISPLPHQTVEVKTNLVKGKGSGDDSLLNGSAGERREPAPPPDRATPAQGPQ